MLNPESRILAPDLQSAIANHKSQITNGQPEIEKRNSKIEIRKWKFRNHKSQITNGQSQIEPAEG